MFEDNIMFALDSNSFAIVTLQTIEHMFQNKHNTQDSWKESSRSSLSVESLAWGDDYLIFKIVDKAYTAQQWTIMR